MKHTTDVPSHRVRSSINSLAMYALENELSNDLVRNEIEKRFNTAKIGKKEKIMKDVLQSCYKLVWDSGFLSQPEVQLQQDAVIDIIDSSAAMILACTIIDTSKRYNQHPIRGKFPEEFYHLCADVLFAEPCFAHCDNELLLIYCKQASFILKTAQIIGDEQIHTFSPSSCYKEMFLAFWNKCNWKNLFPSGGYLSAELKNNRHILLDIILSSKGTVQLDSVANTFYELTGIAHVNDLYAISLLDFSVITWLSFFGILSYQDNSYDKPVTIEVHPYAYSLLQYIL